MVANLPNSAAAVPAVHVAAATATTVNARVFISPSCKFTVTASVLQRKSKSYLAWTSRLISFVNGTTTIGFGEDTQQWFKPSDSQHRLQTMNIFKLTIPQDLIT
jgi:hypothetical protein